MPPSKTAALEKRIAKLEQELAAYKRQLNKAAPGENAAAPQLFALRKAVHHFFDTAEAHGVNLVAFHPDVHAAGQELLRLALSTLKMEVIAIARDPQPSKRTPQ